MKEKAAMRPRFACVITTIQPPSAAVRMFQDRLAVLNASLIVVGDKKGPACFDLDGTEFMSLPDQLGSPFDLARSLPTGHYSRKNIGYLLAIAGQALCIYETDDDNAPLPGWTVRPIIAKAVPVSHDGWVNAYRYFTDELIWPRGFPLDGIASVTPESPGPPADIAAPIQQGLADHSPDVDAVWRLVMDRPFTFRSGQSIVLQPGAWCPFNSQSTWWWPEAYPLMYLPSYCSFRMTDIWRSFIAQRCLWEMGYGVVFHSPEVIQDRNEHDLMRDFVDEIPGYTRNKEIVKVLEGLTLGKGEQAVGNNLQLCYEALVRAGFFPETELILVAAWLRDVKRCFGEK